MKGLRRILAAASACLFLASSSVPAAAGAAEAIEVRARPVTSFRIGSSETRFGPLEFVGGLELTSPASGFGGISGFRFLSPGGDFLAVTDTGRFIAGRVERDEEARPVGFSGVRIADIAGPDGGPTREKWLTDAEGLAVRDGVATVAFEREHRITDHALDGGLPGRRLGDRDFLVPRHELRRNRGFETVAHAPADGPLRGALVAVTEKSLDRRGDIFAAVLDGPEKGVFTVARLGEFDVTDGAFLPDGDLVLLERRYSFATGIAMRLRRISGDGIGRGRRADGPVLIEAGMAYQIDNMEALDIWQRPDGAVVIAILSDDNHSFLQRNLYLEFLLVE